MATNYSIGSLIPGKRMFDAQHMIDALNGVNGITAGTQPVDSSSVTGNATVGGYVDLSTSATLTAVGTNRATALQLAKQVNNIGTAAAGTGVVLPAAATAGVGAIVTIFNNGASLIQVYGSGSDTIDGVAGATGVPLTNALRCQYFCTAAAKWLSAQLGVISA